MKRPAEAIVTLRIGKPQVMEALRDLTINQRDFDSSPWAIQDAIDLEMAARMIRREIEERRKEDGR